jgi:hypothetical protein
LLDGVLRLRAPRNAASAGRGSRSAVAGFICRRRRVLRLTRVTREWHMQCGCNRTCKCDCRFSLPLDSGGGHWSLAWPCRSLLWRSSAFARADLRGLARSLRTAGYPGRWRHAILLAPWAIRLVVIAWPGARAVAVLREDEQQLEPSHRSLPEGVRLSVEGTSERCAGSMTSPAPTSNRFAQSASSNRHLLVGTEPSPWIALPHARPVPPAHGRFRRGRFHALCQPLLGRLPVRLRRRAPSPPRPSWRSCAAITLARSGSGAILDSTDRCAPRLRRTPAIRN